MFVNVPPATSVPRPYAPTETMLLNIGTQDKLWIGGHFYSDKPPVPTLALAGIYLVLQRATGVVAREHPDRFCYALALLSSGLAYVMAVWCLTRRALVGGLDLRVRVLLTASFALGTLALPYAAQVNNHILLLAVCSALMLALARPGPLSVARLLAIGTLIGVGYTMDLGVGPVFVLGTTALVAWTTRRAMAVAVLLLAAFPWFALHHALNYRLGGTFLPASATDAYFLWPGSTIDLSRLTGGWGHQSLGRFLDYALDLPFGARGFLWHDPALLLALGGAVLLVYTGAPELARTLFAVGVMIGSWLVYAALSNNQSGHCASIRWFVPLLAPGYDLLVRLLRLHARYVADLAVLTAGGIALGAVMWWGGPWEPHVPGFWFIVGGTLIGWAWLRVHPARSTQHLAPHPAPSTWH